MDLDEQELKATREKSADEMFKELGFKKSLFGKTQICYSLHEDDDGWYSKTIFFMKVQKKIRLENDYFSSKEIQAIYKKCKELKWIK